MRHKKSRNKLGRTSSHRQALLANMLKSLIEHGQIKTTVAKAKVLKQYADKMVTLAKKGTLASRRRAIAKLRIRFNSLTPKEARQVKQKGDLSSYNADRHIIKILFDDIAPRFENRNGGYTRIIRSNRRVGDNAELCMIQYLPEEA